MADTVTREDLLKVTGALEEVVTHPLLTKRTGTGGGAGGDVMPSSGSGSGYGGGSLTRAAQGAIRDLLGWRYRVDDPKGFLAALNKAVDLKEVEGHVEPTWKARPVMVQADLGEVTGAQAGIYERAKLSVDHALPLLDTLKPLRPDADDESTESVRALVRSSLTELVIELANVGGPRIQRVNEYLGRLLGLKQEHFNVAFFSDPAYAKLVSEPERIGGTLGQVRERFGLKRELVLRVEEERILTNFLIIVGHVTSIFDIWIAQKPFIERNDEPNKFLGTQLVRLSQVLNVIVESVHEAYDAMDSVFFGPEERDVVEIEFDDEPTITVAELLGWVEHFAGVEAPQLIEDSGKDGVDAVKNTLLRLRLLVGAAVAQSENS
jgi:hypothetical protein